MDFYAAWAVAQGAGREDLDNPYSRDSLDRISSEMAERVDIAGRPERLTHVVSITQPLQATASPLLYTAFVPFSRGTYERDLRRFHRASLVLAAAAVLALAWMAGCPPGLALLWLAVAAWLFEPLRVDIRVGNVHQLLLGVLAAALALLWVSDRGDGSRRSLLQLGAGLMLGLGLAFKPVLLLVPFLLAAWRVLSGRTRAAAMLAVGTAAGLALGVVIGAWRFGSPEVWGRWLEALRAHPAEATAVSLGNVSTVRWLAETVGWDPLLPGALVAIALLGGVGAALWQRRGPGTSIRLDDDLCLAALGVTVLLVASPLTWAHYLVLLLPAFLLLLGSGSVEPLRGIPTLVCFAALALRPLWDLGIPTESPVPQLGLVLLFGLLLERFARPPTRPAA